MNIGTEISLQAYGTSEGVKKAWETRAQNPKMPLNIPARIKTEDYLQKQGFKLDQFAPWKADPPATYSLRSSSKETNQANATHTVVVYPDGSWEHFADIADRGVGLQSLKSVNLPQPSLAAGKSVIDLQAYGTSEGLKKAWDARGRGKNTMGERDKKVRAVKTIKLPSGATYYQGKTVSEPMVTPPSKQDLAHNQPSFVAPGTKIKLPSGRLWPEQAYWKQGTPTAEKHPLKDKFRRAGPDVNMMSNTTFKPLPGASTMVYQAKNVGADKAATVFSSHNDKTGEGRIVEFNHDADNRLQYRKQNQQLLSSIGDTQVVRFSSGNAHSNYLRQRYGIDKDFKS